MDNIHEKLFEMNFGIKLKKDKFHPEYFVEILQILNLQYMNYFSRLGCFKLFLHDLLF